MDQAGQEALASQGFCVVRGALGPEAIGRMRRLCAEVVARVSEDHRRQCRAQGSIIDIAEHPVFADVIADPALARLLESLGLGGQVLSTGSVISKPPGGPALFWHQDWWGWQHPVSYEAAPLQVNVMVYLQPTSVGNGCLRVIPGSHRRGHPLHLVPWGDAVGLSRVDDPGHALYQSWEGELAVTVEPGDVVVKDTRLLHSAYANRSGEERTLLSLNFNPGYRRLPQPLQARIRNLFLRENDINGFGLPRVQRFASWPEEARRKIEHLFPDCDAAWPPQALHFAPEPAAMAAG
jgi:ectoine hydroxylase-related dioxygenase (phytanoyl-CoA dioxygenase family)